MDSLRTANVIQTINNNKEDSNFYSTPCFPRDNILCSHTLISFVE